MNLQIHADAIVHKKYSHLSAGSKIPLKILIAMKLTVILVVLFSLNVTANDALAQRVSLKVENANLKTVLIELTKQSGYTFIYKDEHIRNAKPVTVSKNDTEIAEVLPIVFSDQPFDYIISGKAVSITPKKLLPILPTEQQQSTIRGKVTDSLNNPLQNVTVYAVGTFIQTTTDRDGLYELTGVPQDASLLFRLLSYETLEIQADRPVINVVLKYVYSYLDETIVIGYGTTTRRFNTGAVSKVSAEEIAKQPVANPLLALQGRVPGMYIQSTSGRPGSAINVQIRGRNSLAAGNEPLYIVDGVPFTSTSITPNTATSGFLSPLNSINPSDIESIEVLKDADATAIYGSRGSNGVVLITTKKGQIGKAKLDFRLLSGFSQVAAFPEMLNTSEYLQMRRLAFELDGVTPNATNAPDLVLWDTTQYTDWHQYVFGGKAFTTDANISLSGGSNSTTFAMAAGFRSDGTVFRSDDNYHRTSLRMNIGHRNPNDKLRANISLNYSMDLNDLSSSLSVARSHLPPNYPLYDDAGNFYWSPNTLHINPEAFALYVSENRTQSIIGQATLGYAFGYGFDLSTNLGYTSLATSQTNLTPIRAQRPNSLGNANFGQRQSTSWVVEPMLRHTYSINTNRIETLLGTSWQQSTVEGQNINTWNVQNDALLRNIASAGLILADNNYSAYKFQSFYFRATYIAQERYVLNANYRRDGSTRFGPGRRWGNFGAVGGAWIFSEETYLQNAKSFLSYGKLRASYGITGNDQIGDYMYIPAYGSSNPYQGPTLIPTHMANSTYRWESNHKQEIALELGLFKDRVMTTAAHYRNVGRNQLIQYALPTQTGAASITDNFPAVIESRGWEFVLQTTNIRKGKFIWNTTFNLSLPHTRLLEFPDLENSSYGVRNLIIGEPLNQIWLLDIEGIDPQTGLTIVRDLDNSGTITTSGDYTNFGTEMSTAFGGIGNSFKWYGFSLDVFLRFNRQVGRSYTSLNGLSPGPMNNITKNAWDKTWKQPGDVAELPRVASDGAEGVTSRLRYYVNGFQGRYEDASFIKLSNLVLSYALPDAVTQRIRMESANVMFQGQNLFTFTPYNGLDPETLGTQSGSLPNLRVLTLGIQCTF